MDERFKPSRGYAHDFQGECVIGTEGQTSNIEIPITPRWKEVLLANAKWIKALKSRRENPNSIAETNKV